MHITEERKQYSDQEDEIDLREIFFKFLAHWYWFVLFGVLGVTGGYLASKCSQPIYRLESSVLVKEESNGMGLENLYDGFDLRRNTNIENHILMLKSYTLNRQVLENLNWQISWYKEGYFTDVSLYRNYPYNVKKLDNRRNLNGISLYILPLSNQDYKVIADGKVVEEGLEMDIEFEALGKFGEPFENEYFSFILTPNDRFIRNEKDEFYFVFNDLDDLTISCSERLEISLAGKNADGILLTLEGSVPQREVDYLNELIRVYIGYGLQQKNRASENTVRFIDTELNGIADSLNLAGRYLTDFRSRKGIVDLSQEAGLIVDKLQEMEKEKLMGERRFAYFRNLRRYLGDADRIKQMVAPSVEGVTDPAMNALVLKLGELYGKRDVLSYSVQNNNPGLVLLDKEIRDTRQRLGENLNSLISNSEIELEELKKDIYRVNKQLAALPQTEQELINIKRRFDLNNKLYTFLLQKRTEASITMASNLSDAQVLDPARVKTAEKIGPKSALYMAVGAMLGGMIPFLWIVIASLFNDTIQSQEQLERETKLSVVGSIPHNPYDKELPVVDFPRSAITESFRGLRTNLQYLLPAEDQKVIAVHSTVPGEGKSFSSLNLAGILAISQKKVLLVGVDLRKPRLHEVFGVSNDQGVSTYLINQNTFDEIVQPTEIKNLSLVLSGPIPPNPAELLENDLFSQFLQEARKRFDYIVLDNAPVSMVTDGILVGRNADVNLFMVRHKVSHKNNVKFINDVAERETLKQVALVFNDIQYKGSGYGNRSYGYGAGDGDGYYVEEYGGVSKMRFWKKNISSK
ncbi:MAG: GumC family protein [Marinifilaceae bacterium]